ncbi:MAG TPA: hypothetical protein VKB78_03730, partial [Pirellulales bacterium]|nr:hypothetical protein [Pirellulales bacterium]
SGDQLETSNKNFPIFYTLPADDSRHPPNTSPFYEFISTDGSQRTYSTDANWSKPGFKRVEKPLCRVWRNPMPALNANLGPRSE